MHFNIKMHMLQQNILIQMILRNPSQEVLQIVIVSNKMGRRVLG